jgi:SAM-dependent methyltransferase
MNKSSPQAREMGDESMVRNLAAQAEAIWPQEGPILAHYSLPPKARILDVGCGTGEITSRVAELFPGAELLGIDLDEHHLERARARSARYGPRVRFQVGDALQLPLGDAQFDLVICRHLLQAVPSPRRVVEEMRRVARPGAGLHLIAEDYGMLWCHPTQRDPDVFWRDGALVYGETIGTDLRIGRKMFTLLTDLALVEVAVTWLVLDTLRVPRDTFARIWEAWRDGYTESLVAKSRLPRSEIEAYWAEMIACVRNPRGYALWQLPLWTARVPAR